MNIYYLSGGKKYFLFHIPEKHKKMFLENWHIVCQLSGLKHG